MSSDKLENKVNSIKNKVGQFKQQFNSFGCKPGENGQSSPMKESSQKPANVRSSHSSSEGEDFINSSHEEGNCNKSGSTSSLNTDSDIDDYLSDKKKMTELGSSTKLRNFQKNGLGTPTPNTPMTHLKKTGKRHMTIGADVVISR